MSTPTPSMSPEPQTPATPLPENPADPGHIPGQAPTHTPEHKRSLSFVIALVICVICGLLTVINGANLVRARAEVSALITEDQEKTSHITQLEDEAKELNRATTTRLASSWCAQVTRDNRTKVADLNAAYNDYEQKAPGFGQAVDRECPVKRAITLQSQLVRLRARINSEPTCEYIDPSTVKISSKLKFSGPSDVSSSDLASLNPGDLWIIVAIDGLTVPKKEAEVLLERVNPGEEREWSVTIPVNSGDYRRCIIDRLFWWPSDH